MSEASRPRIAALVILHKDSKVALLLRKNTGWMDGKWGLPGGKVDNGEDFMEAAIRELKEEVGIDVIPADLNFVLTMHRSSDGDSWVDVIFQADNWQGEVTNAEPSKHQELRWFSTSSLPENIIPVTSIYLKDKANAIHYDSYGF